MMLPSADALGEQIEALLDELEQAMQMRDRVESQVRIRPTPQSRERLLACEQQVQYLDKLWDYNQSVLELLLQLESSACADSRLLEAQLLTQLEALQRLERQRPTAPAKHSTQHR